MKAIIKNWLERLGLKHTVKNIIEKHPEIGITEVKAMLGINQELASTHHAVVTSLSAYHEYMQRSEEILNKQFNLEKELLHHFKKTFVIHAPCFLTGQNESFLIHCQQTPASIDSNLRETCVGRGTGLNSRIRATLYACFAAVPKSSLHTKKVYLTEAVTPLFHYLKTTFTSVEGSEYLGHELKSGTFINGIRHEDITQMSYADEQFDIGFCLEVLEHVPDYAKAFAELARITRPGGSFFITVPFLEKSEKTLIRAKINPDGSIEHLLPAEYHGDPVNAEGGILCFQHFSWDIADQLKAAGFSTVKFHFIRSWEDVILGYHMLVIEAVK